MNPEYYHAPPTPGNVEAAKAATEAGLVHGMECAAAMAAMDRIAMAAMDRIPVIGHPWELTVELDNGEVCKVGNIAPTGSPQAPRQR